MYRVDPDTGGLELADPGENGVWSEPPLFPDGGGDLVSTVDDYLAFARLLLNGGQYSGTRLLSRPSVELMATDQLTAENKQHSSPDARHVGRGRLGLRRPGDDGPRPAQASIGRYGWNGGLGSSWFNDPREQLIGILLTQRAVGESPKPPEVCADFETSAYAALAQALRHGHRDRRGQTEQDKDLHPSPRSRVAERLVNHDRLHAARGHVAPHIRALRPETPCRFPTVARQLFPMFQVKQIGPITRRIGRAAASPVDDGEFPSVGGAKSVFGEGRARIPVGRLRIRQVNSCTAGAGFPSPARS